MRHYGQLLVAMGLLAYASTLARGQSVEGVVVGVRSPNAEYSAAQLQEYFKQAAESYVIRTKEKRKLKAVPGSLLNWSNPVRNQELGGLFIWTLDERPAVLVTIYTFVASKLEHKHEAISFSEQPLTAECGGRVVWTPSPTTMQWKTIQSPIEPQLGSSRLLLQMRQVARRLHAKKTQRGDEIDLKLLPQPLYQYESKEGGFSGALFAFVEATDPDLVVLVEAYKKSDDQAAWRIGAMPSHWIAVELGVGNETIWESPANLGMRGRREGQQPWSTQPYFNFFTDDQIPPPEELDTK